MLHELNTLGYIVNVNDRSIEEITYADYLGKFGADETTSPRGVAPRVFVEQYEGGNRHSDYEWQVWSWSVGGNNPMYIAGYDTEDEANIHVYEAFENNINENWDAPRFHTSYEDAIEDLANMISRDVDVVKRYLAISAIAAQKVAAQEKAAELRRSQINAAVEVEAAAIQVLIDDEFRAQIKSGSQLGGNDKSQAYSQAFTSLLSRTNYGVIKSDFWKVFKKLNKN